MLIEIQIGQQFREKPVIEMPRLRQKLFPDFSLVEISEDNVD